MRDYDPILNALQEDLGAILLLLLVCGVLHIVPAMVVAFLAAVRTDRILWSELPRGTFWGWLVGVPIWVSVLVLLLGLAEMLFGNSIEQSREELYIGLGAIGFLAAITMQYLVVDHYFRGLLRDRLGWRLDEPEFRAPKRNFKFSLQQLLLAQVGLIFLFGLWVGARREPILREYQRRSELAERQEYEKNLQARFKVHGWNVIRSVRGLWLEVDGPTNQANFDDLALQQIELADRLCRIDIRSDQLTDAGLEILSRHSTLSELDIESKAVTDAGIAHLRKLKRLKKIRLTCPQLTAKAVDDLQTMESLEEVRFSQVVD